MGDNSKALESTQTTTDWKVLAAGDITELFNELVCFFGEPFLYGRDGGKFFLLFGENLQDGRSFWGDTLASAAREALLYYRRHFDSG